MKQFLLFALLLSGCFGFAQNLEKDTIQLNEIFVGNTLPKKYRTVKKSFSGICSFYNTVHYGFERVNLVTDLPEGYISSVTFNFNHKTGRKDTSHEFKDTELQLDFYEVSPTGVPGARIGQPILFTLKGDFTGRMEIKVPYTMVKNPGSFFLGLSRVVPRKPGTKEDIEVHCLCNGDRYKTYQYNLASNTWVLLDSAMTVYKMTIKEIVLPAKKR